MNTQGFKSISKNAKYLFYRFSQKGAKLETLPLAACRKSPKRKQGFSNLNKRNSRISLPQRGRWRRSRRMRRLPFVYCAHVLLIHRKRSPFPAGEGFFVQLYLLYRFFDSLKGAKLETLPLGGLLEKSAYIVDQTLVDDGKVACVDVASECFVDLGL